MTDPIARTFRSALVGLCRGDCGVYVEPYRPGDECPMDCQRPGGGFYARRGLVKRRVLICSECELAYESREAIEEHDCYYA